MCSSTKTALLVSEVCERFPSKKHDLQSRLYLTHSLHMRVGLQLATYTGNQLDPGIRGNAAAALRGTQQKGKPVPKLRRG